MATPELQRPPVVLAESLLLAEAILRILEQHDAATDGRSYTTRHQARSRQRAFLYALRKVESFDVHTHVRQNPADGRWRVYATRAAAYPAAVPAGGGA